MILKYESYLKMIKNSVGTKMFRNLYVVLDNKNKDIAKNGELSCAIFVSNILLIWGMIKEGHATIKRTTEDMIKGGWKKISPKKIKPGDIIVWEEKVFEGGEKHFHIGFYIGKQKAISNSHKKRFPTIHRWDYFGKRKIVTVYQWQKF